MNVPGVGQKKAEDIFAHFNRGINDIPKERWKEPVVEVKQEIPQGRLL